MQKIIAFTGCSYTAGHGWQEDRSLACPDHPSLWCNIVADTLGYQTINYGQGGGSNRDIFRNTVDVLTNYQVDTVIVQWTSMPRYSFELGIEQWPTVETLQNRDRTNDVGVSGLVLPRQQINQIIDNFLALHHLHYEICDLIVMLRCLIKLADRLRTKIFYVNGLCPWDNHYFEYENQETRQPKDLTKFTKTAILNTETRTDRDIFLLYDRIHDNYTRLGTIQSHNWINLYTSFRSLQKDTNLDHQHPGTQSNIEYANTVLRHFQN